MSDPRYQFAKVALIEAERHGTLRQLGQVPAIQGYRLNITSNDYLGLASDPCLAQEFLTKVDIGQNTMAASSSRLMTGNWPAHELVEDLLANVYEREAALTFTCGYNMNVGILPALTTRDSLILADKLVHASLIDGIRLSSAKCIRYRHADMEQLSQLVDRYHTSHDRIIIVTESVFSMDGDLVDLQRIVELRKQYANVLIYLDEAHAIGVLGKSGLGLAHDLELQRHIDLLCGTFGKAAASEGAFVVCDHLIKQLLVNRCRSFIYTTAPMPLRLQWTHFAWKQMMQATARRTHLHRIGHRLKQALGLDQQNWLSNHIIPLLIGDEHEAIAVAQALRQARIYALPMRHPTVPLGAARIRISLTADITNEQMDFLITTLKNLGYATETAN